MNIEFAGDFFKSLKKLNNPALQTQVNKVIETIEAAKTITEIPNLKKLSRIKRITVLEPGIIVLEC